jgi:prefoldin subunit 5
MLVDPEQKANLERELERLNANMRQIATAKREKQAVENDLQTRMDKLDEDWVHCLFETSF